MNDFKIAKLLCEEIKCLNTIRKSVCRDNWKYSEEWFDYFEFNIRIKTHKECCEEELKFLQKEYDIVESSNAYIKRINNLKQAIKHYEENL